MSPTPTPSSTFTTVPSPSPSHVIVELTNQSTGAPWWGVPVIAGGFLLLGGLLTYLLARINESTKFKRERKDRQVREVTEAGAALLTAGDRVKELALLALPRSTADFLVAISGKAKPATDAFALAANAFRLVYPPDMKKAFDEYILTTFTLLLPPFEKEGQQYVVGEHTKASVRLINALRALEGREPINEPTTNPDLLGDAHKIVDRLADDLNEDSLHGRHAAGTTDHSDPDRTA